MAVVQCTHVEVYLFRRRRGRIEFLALRRSPLRRRLPGAWQPVTGRIARNEQALHAAAREVSEETGLTPRCWWALESPTIWFDSVTNALEVLPLFAAEVDARDRVTISAEHDAHRFLVARQAARLFLWETQRRALEAVGRQVLVGGALAAALEVTGPVRSRRAAAQRRRGVPRPRRVKRSVERP